LGQEKVTSGGKRAPHALKEVKGILNDAEFDGSKILSPTI